MTNSGNRKWLYVAGVGGILGYEITNTGGSQIRKRMLYAMLRRSIQRS